MNHQHIFPVLQAFDNGKPRLLFLFSIFINDLRSFLNAHALKGITCDINYEDITSYFKILIC